MHIQRGVKEAQNRDGTERKSGREIIVGKLKTASSKRIVPLNETAIQAIIELRNERYFGEDAPLIPDADGRQLYKTVEFKKTVLFHTRCGRNREKRLTQPAPHLRNKACNRSAS